MNLKKKVLAVSLAAVVATGATSTAFAANTPLNPSDFSTWNTTWTSTESKDSGKIVMTPGKTASELNFAWYSESKGVPAVRIAESQAALASAASVSGAAASINEKNTDGSITYTASNKVALTGLKPKTSYFYQYSSNGVDWSTAYAVKTGSTETLKLLYVGDPQIGASGSVANDTFNWNYTLQSAVNANPDASFILSAGDQINHETGAAESDRMKREGEYAGFLYPAALRSLPVATVVGNHESLGNDYKYHYNNPNTQANLGETASGCDYYFNYGNTLFIMLNSNNRNSAEHDSLIKQAVNDPASKDAQWKVVMFHHDIYGSGDPHSDIDGANLRALFAPLMDKYNIDVCLTGHDHSYARTYQIMDGKTIDYGYTDGNTVNNPQGTLYIAANSASGSKFYSQNNMQQYYVKARNQENKQNYSTINITGSSFTIQTFRVDGSLVDETTVNKTEPKESLINQIAKANELKNSSDYAAYTMESRKALEEALAAANSLLDTGSDGVPAGLYGAYDKSIQGDNAKDKLNYYAYAPSNNGKAVEEHYADFIDKTLYGPKVNGSSSMRVDVSQLNNASKALGTAITSLTKSSDSSNTDTGSSGSSGKNPSPGTGDTTDLALMGLLAAMALTGTGAAILHKRKGNAE